MDKGAYYVQVDNPTGSCYSGGNSWELFAEVMPMKKVVSEISGIVFSLPWLVAKDYGLFEAEGIDMEFVRAQGSGVVQPSENPGEVNPILGHVAFEQGRVSIYRA